MVESPALAAPAVRGKGQLAVFGCAVLWSTSGLFIKLLDWHPLVIAGSRSLVAVLFLWGARTAFPRRGRAKSRLLPFVAAGFAYALTMICFVSANKLTAPANAILLQYSAPVWAAVLGWALLREKPRLEHWLALALVSAGLVIFFRESLERGALVGDCVAVLSGVLFGAHSVLLRMQREGNPADSMMLSHVICVLIALPFVFLYPPALSLGAAGALIYMGTLQIGAASLLFTYGIRRISAVSAMLTAMIEPVLNPVWVLAITGERPSLPALAGGGIIVTAVAVSSFVGLRRGSASPRKGGSPAPDPQAAA